MNQRAMQDLVDSYLLNQISPEDKARLLAMMEADPVFAQHVRESEETFRVLRAARNRELRKKLKTWDAVVKKTGRRIGKGLMFFLLFISMLLASWCWLGYHFSPVTMARHAFDAIPENNLHGDENTKYPVGWQAGIEAFRQEDYEKAKLVFMSCSLTDDPVWPEIARWNLLLCHLAMNGTSGEWLKELNDFSNNASDPIRAEAKKLVRVIHSPLYTFSRKGILHKTVASVKPKII